MALYKDTAGNVVDATQITTAADHAAVRDKGDKMVCSVGGGQSVIVNATDYVIQDHRGVLGVCTAAILAAMYMAV